jgi:hypothetical protein
MPKPTILLALDPHSAVLSAAIKRQLQKLNSPQSHLIQTYTLTHNGQTFGFSSDLDPTETTPDPTQTHSKQTSVSEIRTKFSQQETNLQTALINLLKSASQSPQAIAAKNQGVQISSTHRIYLMLSASNLQARGVIFDLVRLIRWLFSKYFTFNSSRA